jgi:hypothetical protein
MHDRRSYWNLCKNTRLVDRDLGVRQRSPRGFRLLPFYARSSRHYALYRYCMQYILRWTVMAFDRDQIHRLKFSLAAKNTKINSVRNSTYGGSCVRLNRPSTPLLSQREPAGFLMRLLECLIRLTLRYLQTVALILSLGLNEEAHAC